MSKKGDILQRGSYKTYTSKDRAMLSWVLYPPRWKSPDGFGAGISSTIPNCGHEDEKTKGEMFKFYIHLFIPWVITTLMYVIVIG